MPVGSAIAIVSSVPIMSNNLIIPTASAVNFLKSYTYIISRASSGISESKQHEIDALLTSIPKNFIFLVGLAVIFQTKIYEPVNRPKTEVRFAIRRH
jgi:hypothetical protein